jgi:3'-5' exoribonuclease-like protein
MIAAMNGRPHYVYFSLDVEADGPYPGDYSMRSFGLAVAGRCDYRTFEAVDPAAQTFYRELRPISESFEPWNLAVSGLDRDTLLREGAEPESAMIEAANWVWSGTDGGGQPVAVAWPLGFDWMFLHYYFMRFARQTPFDHSKALDMKTMYAMKSGGVLISKEGLPSSLRSERPHTHNALDDAIEQGDIFARLFTWDGKS